MSFFEINLSRLLFELNKPNEPGINRVMNWFMSDGFLFIYVHVGGVCYRYSVESIAIPESVRMLLRGEDHVLGYYEEEPTDDAVIVVDEEEGLQDGGFTNKD